MSNLKRFAEPGFVWQCQACGKISETDAYGIEGKHDRGWDESCALNCVQVPLNAATGLPSSGGAGE